MMATHIGDNGINSNANGSRIGYLVTAKPITNDYSIRDRIFGQAPSLDWVTRWPLAHSSAPNRVIPPVQ